MNATPTMMNDAQRRGYQVLVIINGEHYDWNGGAP